MTDLSIAVLAGMAAAVEVGNLTLLVRRHQFGGERQADALPACAAIHILLIVGLALIPHTMAFVEGIGHRRIEVHLVHELMVVGGNQVALYEVTVDGRGVLAHDAITFVVAGVIVIVVINRIDEVAAQHIQGLLIGVAAF